jgi:hypothetical protein
VPGVEIAALIMSGAALLVSLLTAVYARRQTRANEQLTEIERSRRLDERADIEQRRFQLIRDRHRIFLVNDGDGPAYGVRVTGTWRGKPMEIGTRNPHDKLRLRHVRGRTVKVIWHLKPDLSDPERERVLILDE